LKSDKLIVDNSCKFYRSLSDIINTCLNQSSMIIDTYSGPNKLHFDAASELLVAISSKLPYLIPTESVISFAVPSDTTSMNRNLNDEITWLHASEGFFDKIHFPNNTKVTSDIVDICINLAKTCLFKKVKSVCSFSY
jgi:hypothetical protein